jgi:hypothetical protein
VDDRATIFIFIVCFLVGKVQVDVNTAFLNGELDEGVHVRIPRGIAGWPCRMKRLLKPCMGLNMITRLGTLKFLATLFEWAFLS